MASGGWLSNRPRTALIGIAGLVLVAAQVAAAANVRPSGVVLDIRGHTLPQFQTSPLAVFPQLLTTLTDAVAAWKGFGQPTPLTVTVPSFFDTGLYQYQVGATQQSFMRWIAAATAADPSNGLVILNSQDNSVALIQAGNAGCTAAAAVGVTCSFAVDITNTSYNPGTFFEEGIAYMVDELVQVGSGMALTAAGTHYVGASVFDFEALAAKLNITLPSQPATPPPATAAPPATLTPAATGTATATAAPRTRDVNSTASPTATGSTAPPTPTTVTAPPTPTTATAAPTTATAAPTTATTTAPTAATATPTPTTATATPTSSTSTPTSSAGPTGTQSSSPTPPSNATAAPTGVPATKLNITVQIFDPTLVYRGANNWTSLWTGLDLLRSLYGLNTVKLQLDATVAILADPAGVQAFVNAAAARQMSVDLYLTNQNWALASFHDSALNTLLAAAHLIYQGTETYPPSTTPLPTSPVMLTIAPPVTAAPPTTGPTSVTPTTQATLPAISTPQPQIPSAAAPRVDLPSLVITLALGVVLAGIAWLHPSV